MYSCTYITLHIDSVSQNLQQLQKCYLCIHALHADTCFCLFSHNVFQSSIHHYKVLVCDLEACVAAALSVFAGNASAKSSHGEVTVSFPDCSLNLLITL